MNFLFINGHFPQYSQTFVHDQIKSIKSETGYNAYVFARSLTKFRFEDSTYECDKGILYARPIDKKLIVRVISNTLLHPLRAIRLAQLRLQKKITHSTFLLGLQLTASPNLAITHFGNNYENGIELRKHIFPKMKNVIVFHGHDISSYIQKHGWKNYQRAAPYIDCAICVNEAWANLLKKNTTILDVRTIYLGTQIRPFSRCRNGDAAVYSILFVGRLVEKKGFDILYQAVRTLQITDERKLRVHCIGDGPFLTEYKQRASDDGFKESFVFYGAQQRSFAQRLMAECDLIVVPSKLARDGDSEGLPVVLMEAMAAGIPIISTYHSGIPELIEDKITGILVPENDINQLKEAIAFAIANPETMRAMAVRAYAHVMLYHDEVTQTRRFVEVIKEIA